jgi:hypothetical protein
MLEPEAHQIIPERTAGFKILQPYWQKEGIVYQQMAEMVQQGELQDLALEQRDIAEVMVPMEQQDQAHIQEVVAVEPEAQETEEMQPG